MSLSLSLILMRTQHEHSHKDITKKTKAYAGTFRSASITAKTHKQACCAVANSASDRRRTATQRQQQPWWLWRVRQHNKLKKQSKGKKREAKKKKFWANEWTEEKHKKQRKNSRLASVWENTELIERRTHAGGGSAQHQIFLCDIYTTTIEGWIPLTRLQEYIAMFFLIHTATYDLGSTSLDRAPPSPAYHN